MKEVWYQYVMDNKSLWTHGMTLKRLEKVKDSVLADKHIMSDLLIRHGGQKLSPLEMKHEDPHTFDHGIGNFVCNIHYKMMDLKIIKG